MLKKVIVGSIIVGVLALLIFGFGPVKGYILGARQSAQKFVSDITPTELDVSKIEVLIRSEAEKIGEFEDEIGDLDDKIVGEENKVKRLNAEIAEQKNGLAIAGKLIAEKQKTYLINGRERKFMEVEADATARVKYLTTLKTQLALSQNLIDTLSKTSVSCRGNLTMARQNVLAKSIELEQLKAREINAEIQAKAAALSKSLTGMSDSILNHSDLQEAMKIYEGKINKKERQAGRAEQGGAPWIDYAEPKENLDLLSQIEEALVVAK